MDFTNVNMCLGNSPHPPHNVQITMEHSCEGPKECGKGGVNHKAHTITKVILVPCDGMPA